VISVELKVNDTVVGTLEAEHVPSCRACTEPGYRGSRHRYFVVVTQLSGGEERARGARWISHDPDQGAWALIQDALNLHPKEAWR